jgi:Transposase DDE domain
MRDIRSLEQTLAQNLPWHRARIKFVAAFMLALVTVKNVNLVEIACAFAGKAKQESQYKKLQRFFRFFELPYAEIAECVVKLLGVPGPWHLTLDRTNWQFGQTDLNILLLGIVHQGLAYPLVWVVLPKAGNSHTDERITVVEIFLDLFGKEQIACLLADREFVGREWLRYLKKQGINFHLRVRENFRVTNGRGQSVPVWKLFRATRVNQPLIIDGPRRMWGDEWYFSGCYLGSGEYLIIVSPTPAADAVPQYARRWEIETLFAAMKTRGLRPGADASDRPRATEPLARAAGADFLLVSPDRRVVAPRESAQTQEARAQTEVALPAWVRSFASDDRQFLKL